MADICETEGKHRELYDGGDLHSFGEADDDNKAHERAQVRVRYDQATRWGECSLLPKKGHDRSKVLRHKVHDTRRTYSPHVRNEPLKK